MSIKVRFFASLHEQLGLSETDIDVQGPVSLQKVWEQSTCGAAMPPSTLCAVNMDYARLEDTAEDGDEVAFFPPVTGGAMRGSA